MTTYVRLLHKKDLYEFAVSSDEEQQTKKVHFVNLYEQGQSRPKRIRFAEVPIPVTDDLITKLYDS